MVPSILELKLATTMMAGWLAASTPAPLPVQTVAVMLEGAAAAPVAIELYDVNRRLSIRATIERDGSADPATRDRLTDAFRCRFTSHRAPMAQRTLAMLADLADRYRGHTIELVSAHRATRAESWTSPHRASRALDFRVRGVPPREIRDYLWRKYEGTGIGIGWYPAESFVHMDSRTGPDIAWTFQRGENHYRPYWAELARARDRPAPRPRHGRPGS
jgi:uncharacterized protein YcbK (DUF882 family)